MAGPPPVEIQFVTKGLDQVLKSLKSIQDATLRTQRQSVAAAKASASDEQKIVEKKAKEQAGAIARSQKMAFAATAAGFADIAKAAKAQAAKEERELRVRLSNITKHVNAQQREEARAQRIRLANLTRHLNAEYKAKVASEKQAAKEQMAIWKAADKAVADAKKAGATEARKHATREATIGRQLRVERNKLALEEMYHGAPRNAMLAPAARRRLIDSAEGKSLEEQARILEKAKLRRQAAQLDRAGARADAKADDKHYNAAIAAAKAQEKAKQAAISAEHRAAEKRRRDLEVGLAKISARHQEAAYKRLEAEKTAAERKRFDEQKHREQEAAREAQRWRERFGQTAGRGIGRAVAGVTTAAGRAARGLLNAGGGFDVSTALREEANFERQAALLAVKAPGGARPTAAVIKKARAVATETGTDATDILAAWSEYTEKTGDFWGGEKNARFFAKYAKATGADLREVGRTAGLLRVQNKDLAPAAMQQLLLDTLAQGRTGAVDVPELAGHVAAITKTAAQYQGSQQENQRRLIALSQIGVRTGSVSEAATAVSNLSADTMNHHREISAFLGADTFNQSGQIAMGPEEYVARIFEKTKGDPRLMMSMGSDKQVFGQRTLKLFNALLPTYHNAKEKALAGGSSAEEANKAGAAAVVADMKQFTDASYSSTDMEKDFAEVMRSSAEQFEGAVRDLKMVIGQELLPVLTPMVKHMRDLVPALADLVRSVAWLARWFADNPFVGLGGLVAAAIIKEIAAAQLASVLEQSMSKSMAATGAISIASAALSIMAAKLIIDKLADEDEDKGRNQLTADIAYSNVRPLLKPGAASSPQDVEAMKDVAAQLQASIKATEESKGGSTGLFVASMVGAWIRDAFTLGFAGASTDVLKARKDQVERDEASIAEQKAKLDELNKAIAEATKSLRDLSATSATASDVANPGAPKRNAPIGRREGG